MAQLIRLDIWTALVEYLIVRGECVDERVLKVDAVVSLLNVQECLHCSQCGRVSAVAADLMDSAFIPKVVRAAFIAGNVILRR